MPTVFDSYRFLTSILKSNHTMYFGKDMITELESLLFNDKYNFFILVGHWYRIQELEQ